MKVKYLTSNRIQCPILCALRVLPLDTLLLRHFLPFAFVVAIHLLIVTTFIVVYYKFQRLFFMPPEKAARDLSHLRTLA
jgi:hypothetical protein